MSKPYKYSPIAHRDHIVSHNTDYSINFTQISSQGRECYKAVQTGKLQKRLLNPSTQLSLRIFDSNNNENITKYSLETYYFFVSLLEYESPVSNNDDHLDKKGFISKKKYLDDPQNRLVGQRSITGELKNLSLLDSLTSSSTNTTNNNIANNSITPINNNKNSDYCFEFDFKNLCITKRGYYKLLFSLFKSTPGKPFILTYVKSIRSPIIEVLTSGGYYSVANKMKRSQRSQRNSFTKNLSSIPIRIPSISNNIHIHNNNNIITHNSKITKTYNNIKIEQSCSPNILKKKPIVLCNTNLGSIPIPNHETIPIANTNTNTNTTTNTKTINTTSNSNIDNDNGLGINLDAIMSNYIKQEKFESPTLSPQSSTPFSPFDHSFNSSIVSYSSSITNTPTYDNMTDNEHDNYNLNLNLNPNLEQILADKVYESMNYGTTNTNTNTNNNTNINNINNNEFNLIHGYQYHNPETDGFNFNLNGVPVAKNNLKIDLNQFGNNSPQFNIFNTIEHHPIHNHIDYNYNENENNNYNDNINTITNNINNINNINYINFNDINYINSQIDINGSNNLFSQPIFNTGTFENLYEENSSDAENSCIESIDPKKVEDVHSFLNYLN